MKLTKEEKAVVRAVIKMNIVKDYGKPSEFAMSELVGNMNDDCRWEMEEFINKEWEKNNK